MNQPETGRRAEISPAAVRLALVLEFLVAIIAVFTVWSYTGGQDHLDMIPWHWKLFLAGVLSLAVVRATSAAVEHENPWNGTVMGWLATALIIAIVIGSLTYYYHLHEQEEEQVETSGRT